MKTQAFLRAFGVAALASGAAADVITLEPSKDNSLYEDPTGMLSSGAGTHVFSGVTIMSAVRRALLHFDVAGAVPAGSTINSATLTMSVTMSITGATDMSLHTVSQDWGEGTSFGAGTGQGEGGVPSTGDATWVHTFFATSSWTTVGGDFAALASATSNVSSGAIPFTSAAMATDVQGWLDTPAGNFGWVLKADDEATPNAKRFGSRENSTVSDRPMLLIDYTPPGTGTSFCSSLPNATGFAASLTAAGMPNSTLVFTSTPVPETTGQFFFGPMMLGGSPFGDGLLCAGGMTQRLLPFVAAGMMMLPANTAVFTVNYTAPYASGLTGTRYFQHWFRSGVPGSGFNTSDGLEISF